MAEYLVEENLLKLGEIDPELQQFLEANPPPPVDCSSLEAYLAMFEKRAALAKQMLGETPPGVILTELAYPTRDGSQNRARLFQPAQRPAEGSPLILMFHGGGFCVGSPEGEEQTCRNFTLAFGATCVSIGYRLAPQYRYPHAADDAWDALQWCVANAAAWGADPSAGFVVGGTSAGGNLAAVVTHMARDEALSPPLTGQYLAIPWLHPVGVTPEKYKKYWLSAEQNQVVPVLPREVIQLFNDGYRPNNNDAVKFAVFNHPNGHQDLPPTYFQIDGMDPLRDEGIVFERILRKEAGINTRMTVYPGMPHGHWGFFPMLKASVKARRDQLDGMGWLLHKTPDWAKAKIDPTPAMV